MVDSTQKKFVVDEGGNKRQAISADDIKQTLNDLKSWYKTNAPTYYTQKLECAKGASELEVNQILSSLGIKDESLKILLTIANGGF